MRRDTFQLNKEQQQYTAPALRASCWNCKHQKSLYGQCSKGGFYVQPFAICKEHKPAPKEAT